MATQTLTHPENTRIGQAVLWILQIIGAFVFFPAGFAKLTGDPMMVGMFEAIGVGQWFRYLTGLIEVGSAVLLLIPRLAGIGALLLVATMIGAIFMHLFVIGGSPAMPISLLIMMTIVAYGRRERTLRLIQ